MDKSITMICSECKKESEFSVVSVSADVAEITIEKVWQCSNCGHEEIEKFLIVEEGVKPIKSQK